MRSNVSLVGSGDRAMFRIGLSVEKPRPKSMIRRKGAKIPPGRATSELIRLRAKQVGLKTAKATMRFWVANSRSMMRCEVVFVPSSREKRLATFRRHMLDLSELIAERLGQKEVQLSLDYDTYRIRAPSEKDPQHPRKGRAPG